MRKGSDHGSGFTLIEVVVALAIVSIAMLSIVDSINKHSNVSSVLERKVLSNWVASNVIAEIRHAAKTEKIKRRSSSSSVDMGGHSWRTKTKIKKTDVENVYLVTVEVFDSSGAKDAPVASMTSAVTDPT